MEGWDTYFNLKCIFRTILPNLSYNIFLLFFFSYVKGHILLTWDLGAGPRRIFTKRPVDERYFVHSVQFGRYGRLGYLQVDNFPNITGRAPGLRENLNITSKVKMAIFIIWCTYVVFISSNFARM